MHRIEAKEFLKSTNGRIFRVTFRKRSTGSTRKLVGRFGVTKGLTGEGPRYNASRHDLLNVYELVDIKRDEQGRIRETIGQWRCIPIEGIQEIEFAGKKFQVQD